MIKNAEMNIWGRDFSIPVEFECFDGVPVTEAQNKALQKFLAHVDWLEAAEKAVEDYCKKAVQADHTNEKKDNIFSYVKPHYLFVKQDKSCPRVAIMCKYRYEPEHGLAIVFTHDGKATVGIQDIVL